MRSVGAREIVGEGYMAMIEWVSLNDKGKLRNDKI